MKEPNLDCYSLEQSQHFICDHPLTIDYKKRNGKGVGVCSDYESSIDWMWCVVKFISNDPTRYHEIKNAFSKHNPFTDLGWDSNDEIVKTIFTWWWTHQPLFDYVRQEYCFNLSFHCYKEPPLKFLEYLSDKYNIKVHLKYYANQKSKTILIGEQYDA